MYKQKGYIFKTGVIKNVLLNNSYLLKYNGTKKFVKKNIPNLKKSYCVK